MASPLPIVLIGCGGHASDVLSVIEACDPHGELYRLVGYLDDDLQADDRRLRGRGIARLDSIDAARAVAARFVLGVGYPAPRDAVLQRLGGRLEPAPPFIHPNARLATGVDVGLGAIVFDGVGIGPLATVGRFSLLARGVTVGHDATISDNASLMPGCVVSGDVFVGRSGLVGANATVLEGRSMGDESVLGAGAVLTCDLPPNRTAVGVPARVTGRQT